MTTTDHTRLTEKELNESKLRFESYRTPLGLLRFLISNPRMLPHLASIAVDASAKAIKNDHALHYSMQLQALHSVSSTAELGQDVWSDLDTFVRLFASVAKPTDRCLELGVGGGRLTARIAPLVRVLVAQDVSDHNFDEVRRVTNYAKNIEFLAYKGPGDNLPTEAFEIVACTDVLTVIDLEELVNYSHNVFRSLVRGGHFIASTKTIDDVEEIDRYLNTVESFSQPLYRYPTDLYTRLFERAGFEVKELVRSKPEEELGPQNGLHLNLILRRPE
jgi:SAM-dependent methyltransferase